MGVTLYIDISDGTEDPKESLSISKRFYEQVICDWKLIYDQEVFFSEKEREILRPNEYGQISIGSTKDLPNREEYLNLLKDISEQKPDIQSLDEYLIEHKVLSEEIKDRERDPQSLLQVIQKIESYFKENVSKLPVIHYLYDAKEKIGKEDEAIHTIDVKGINAHVEGDLYSVENYPEVRNKIRLKSYLDDFGKVDLWFEVKPEMEIEGKLYFSQTQPLIEVFEKEFQRVYTLLQKAVSVQKKVLWEYV